MRSCLCILLLITVHVCFSQKNFQKGTVVLTNGDTLKGFIDYREWSVNPVSIDVKAGTDDITSKTYGPHDVRYFEVNDTEYYLALTTTIRSAETSIGALGIGPNDNTSTITGFFKILQQGTRLTLLLYRGENKTRLFIIDAKNPDKIEELIYQRYYENADKKRIVERPIFRNQIFAKATSYGVTLTNQLSTLHYDTKEILSVISRINGIDYRKAAKSSSEYTAPSIRFFAGLGINFGTAKIDGKEALGGSPLNYFQFDGMRSDAISIKPKITAGADLLFNPKIGKSILRFEVSVYQVVNTMSGVETISSITAPPRYYDMAYSFTQNNVLLLPQYVNNFYNTPDLKAFFAVGFGMNFSSYPDKNPYTRTPHDPAYYYEAVNIENLYSLRGFSYSLPLTMGITIRKNLEISAKYLYPLGGISNDSQTKIKMTSFDFGMKYLFNKRVKG